MDEWYGGPIIFMSVTLHEIPSILVFLTVNLYFRNKMGEKGVVYREDVTLAGIYEYKRTTKIV